MQIPLTQTQSTSGDFLRRIMEGPLRSRMYDGRFSRICDIFFSRIWDIFFSLICDMRLLKGSMGVWSLHINFNRYKL